MDQRLARQSGGYQINNHNNNNTQKNVKKTVKNTELKLNSNGHLIDNEAKPANNNKAKQAFEMRSVIRPKEAQSEKVNWIKNNNNKKLRKSDA